MSNDLPPALLQQARESLERQIRYGSPAMADARIARLRELGMQKRAENVLAARIKVFGSP